MRTLLQFFLEIKTLGFSHAFAWKVSILGLRKLDELVHQLQAFFARQRFDLMENFRHAHIIRINLPLPQNKPAFRHLGNAKKKSITTVGKSAARKSFPGAMPSGKYFWSNDCPAGLGALAMTVRPPPQIAPDVTAILS